MVVQWCVTEAGAVLTAVGESRALSLAGEDAATRRAAFRDRVDGDAHVAARVLARMLLAEAVGGTDPADWRIEQRCDDPGCRRAEAHGRPLAFLGDVQGPALSWSHSKGLIACAVAVDAGRIGIDVEQALETLPPFAGSWRGWVRAEALVKAGVCDLETALELRVEHDEHRSADGRPIRLHDLEMPLSGAPGAPLLVGALAVRASTPIDSLARIPLSALCSPHL